MYIFRMGIENRENEFEWGNGAIAELPSDWGGEKKIEYDREKRFRWVREDNRVMV